MKTSEKREAIKALLEDANAQFVSVSFIKKDGTIRKMNTNPHAIRSHVLGEAASPSAQQAVETRKKNNPNLYNCWDAQADAARSINLDTVFEVRSKGLIHVFPLDTTDDES